MSFAIAHDSIVNMAVFLTAGIGFGLPYLILIFCPVLIKYLPKPGKWLTGFKYILALLLLGTLFWLLSILYAQLGWRPTLGLFFLLVLLKFIIENIRQPFLLKLVLVISIILCGMYLPQTAYKEDLRLDIENAELWQNFDTNRILEYTSAGRIVVVDITADWCVTCKFNKFMLWDQERTIRLLRKHNVVAMRGDYTNGAENITRYLMQNHVHGIPFNVIYGPSTKDKKSSRIVLPVIVSYNELQKAIETLIKESKKYKSD